MKESAPTVEEWVFKATPCAQHAFISGSAASLAPLCVNQSGGEGDKEKEAVPAEP